MVVGLLPGWEVVILTFTIGVRGSYDPNRWNTILSRFGLTAVQTELLTRALVSQTLAELTDLYSARYASLHNAQSGSDEIPALLPQWLRWLPLLSLAIAVAAAAVYSVDILVAVVAALPAALWLLLHASSPPLVSLLPPLSLLQRMYLLLLILLLQLLLLP